jgi:hypothetical protein
MAIGLRNHAQFAESKAFWDMLMVDADGYIWLQIPYADGSLRPRPPREKQRLLSPLGEYLGITEWPAVDRVTWIGDGYLLSIVVEEETGLEVPTVFRIKPVIEGLEYPVSQGAAVPGH